MKKAAAKGVAVRKATGKGAAPRITGLDALLTRIHSDIDEAHRLLDDAAR